MKTIALIFDFDDTLAPDSTSAFLESMGVNAADFWKNEVHPLDNDDWDPIPAYMFALLKLSASSPDNIITRQRLADFGRKLKFHKGLTRFFDQMREFAHSLDPDLRLEFYVISSGIGEIIRSSRIAHHFTEIWASDFLYNDAGHIVFPRKIISFTEKTRYVFQVSKGIIGKKSKGNPFEVNKKVQYKDFKVRLEHMIFVGDGLTDIPCFSLIKRYNGVTFAVYDKNRPDRWGRAWNFIEDGRVSNLLSANYSADSDLSTNLKMAVQNIYRKIQEEQG
ncbi:MAG: HAD family hydrolase [Bacteroidales bacterium]|nr:HAD family hydrolase [Bacteroidales bacterium]